MRTKSLFPGLAKFSQDCAVKGEMLSFLIANDLRVGSTGEL